MVDLYLNVRKSKTLEKAWRVVKASAQMSSSEEIRNSANDFDADYIANLRNLQTQLRKEKFYFKPQKGIAKKRLGKDPRPLIIAPIENRIVQRAILDVMQDCVPYVNEVLNVQTSFGGIKGKRVELAVEKVKEAFTLGAKYYLRSDIPSFFTKLNKTTVLEQIRPHLESDAFYRLLSDAIDTTLVNLSDLQRKKLADYFPVGVDGIAQGSPLSPLIANIYLSRFDREMNQGGIICVRYIDDFVILGSTEKQVFSAFRRCEAILKRIGLTAYSPHSGSEKADHGQVRDGIDFLGCYITPGLVQPSKKARKSLLAKIDEEVVRASHAAKYIAEGGDLFTAGCYGQALSKINKVVWGWGKSFSFCNGLQVAKSLDAEISNKLAILERNVRRFTDGADYRVRQKIAGINLLEEIFLPVERDL